MNLNIVMDEIFYKIAADILVSKAKECKQKALKIYTLKQ